MLKVLVDRSWESKKKIHQCCSFFQEFYDDDRIIYVERTREIGILDPNGAINKYIEKEDIYSIILLRYCPWCGSKLPKDLRDEWFEVLDEIGIEAELFVKKGDVPNEFLTDEWWKKRDL